MLNAVRARPQARTHHKILVVIRNHGVDGLAIFVYAFGPIRRAIGKRTKILPRLPVKDVRKSALVRVQDHLALAPRDVQVQKHGLGGRVVIIQIVRRLLKIPLQLSRIGVQRDQRCAIEI